MSYEYSEDGLIEAASQEVLEKLGWQLEYAWGKESFSRKDDRSDGLLGRANKSEVILRRYLLSALKKFNQGLPDSAYRNAVDQVVQAEADKSLAAINKAKHGLLTQGIPVSYQDDKGASSNAKIICI